MFAVCFLLAVPFLVVSPEADVGTAIIVASAGALVAALADGVPLIVRDYVIDDNISIPVGAGVAMWVALVVL